MNDRAHIVEIDHIVLTGIHPRHPGNLSALIEKEVRRALEGTGLRTSMGLASNETRVAGKVARTVVRSIQGGSNGV
jgi:hypothetical protein